MYVHSLSSITNPKLFREFHSTTISSTCTCTYVHEKAILILEPGETKALTWQSVWYFSQGCATYSPLYNFKFCSDIFRFYHYYPLAHSMSYLSLVDNSCKVVNGVISCEPPTHLCLNLLALAIFSHSSLLSSLTNSAHPRNTRRSSSLGRWNSAKPSSSMPS